MRVLSFRTLQRIIFTILFGWWVILAKNVSNTYFFDEDGLLLWSDDNNNRPQLSRHEIYGRDRQHQAYARGRKFRRSSIHGTSNGTEYVIYMNRTAENNDSNLEAGHAVADNSANDDGNSYDGDNDDDETIADSGLSTRTRTTGSRGRNRMRKNRRHFKRSHNRTSRKKSKKVPRPQLLLPTPIIVMGFPKAGTSSLFAFFRQQGCKSQHW